MKNELEKHNPIQDATIWLFFETDDKELDPLEPYEEDKDLIEYHTDPTDEKPL